MTRSEVHVARKTQGERCVMVCGGNLKVGEHLGGFSLEGGWMNITVRNMVI